MSAGVRLQFLAVRARLLPQEERLHAISAVIARGGISGRLIRGSRPPCANPRRPRACRNRVLKRNSHACAALASADLPARAAGTRQHSQSRRRRSATTAAGEPRFPPRIFRLDRLRRKSSAGVLRRVAGSASQIGGLARQIINRAAKLGLELARCLVQLAVDLGAGIARQTANRILYAAQGLLAFTLV
jgi:hypothetical protein